MAEEKQRSGTGLPDWTSKDERKGLDHLAMQNACIQIYQSLLPGISNVTLRIRYYGFFAWLTLHYAVHVRNTNADVWRQFLRRAEALYALVTTRAHLNFRTSENQGVAGNTWAEGVLREERPEGRIEFHQSTDRGSAPQYLKQAFGVFGAAYGSQLQASGVLTTVDNHPIPVVSEAGKTLAAAFEASVGEVGLLFLAAAENGVVTLAELDHMRAMGPEHILKDGPERECYEALLFGHIHPDWDSAGSRSQTLRLILQVARANGLNVNEKDVRWALYAGCNVRGEELVYKKGSDSLHRYGWRVYQANDLLHVVYEALLKLSLDEASLYPAGLPLASLIAQVTARLQRSLAADWPAATWAELLDIVPLVANAASEQDALSERKLSDFLVASSSSEALAEDEFASHALLLLAVLHKRLDAELEDIGEKYPVLVQGGGTQTILTEFKFLRDAAHQPLKEMLLRLLKSRVIERHMWVALQKFRGRGEYTFLLESDDGRLRKRMMTLPTLTTPRLLSAIAFLEDIHLLGDSGPTEAGLALLEAT